MLSALRRVASRARNELRFRLTGEDRRTYFDLRDLPRINKQLRSGGLPSLDAPPAPDALRGEWPLRVFEIIPELREGVPLGLTPAHREHLIGWAIHHSVLPHKVDPYDLLALLAHLDILPDRGLELTYRLTPEWQKTVPDALATPAGWERLKAHVRTEYRIRGAWLDRATLAAFDPPPAPRGVNVVAHFDYPSGLQQAAEGLVDALHRAGFGTALRDLPVHHRADPSAPRKHGFEWYDTTIVVAGVSTFPDYWYKRAGLWRRPGVRRIAVWYWEMEEVPAEWVPQLGWADEVWAATRFVADAFRKVVTVPVRVVPPGLELPAFVPLPRSHFGLADDRFVFLFTFDMASTLARKNPLGLIEAFRQAFTPADPVELVVKVSRGETNRPDLERLTEACAAAGVRLIDRILPRDELLALMGCCDSYVSLHRSEGLGLGMAEAMLLGKPVVGTAYSGNLDFMTDANSYLVRAGRVASGAAANPYPAGLMWGDPDLAHAAELLRRVVEQPAEARAKGERARAELRDLLSMDAYSRRVEAALAPPG